MARIRSVHPDLCTSETMASLPASAERTFVRLWTHCDDDGRCADNVRLIKAAIYPLHDDMTLEAVDADLRLLAEKRLITRYEVDGRPFIAVRSWEEFQHPQKRRPSKLPPPSGTPPVVVRDVSGPVVGGGEGVGGEQERERPAPSLPGAALALVEPHPSPPPAAVPPFDDFWQPYPRKLKRQDAERAWRQLSQRDQRSAIEAAHGYAAVMRRKGTDSDHMMHGATFLRNRRWADYLPGAPGMAEVAAPRNGNGRNLATIQAALLERQR